MRAAPVLVALLALTACRHTQAKGEPAALAHAASDAIPEHVPACPADASVMDGWSDRAPPRRIFGTTYYVGTCGISSILVIGTQGAVLIDGATEQAPPAIVANIRALGFKPDDVKFILNTHEHNDHAGGLAQLQRDTGAPLYARVAAVPALRRGRGDRSDPQFDGSPGFPPVADVRKLPADGSIALGDLRMTAIATPGHTPGATSWTWQSCEDGRCLHMVYADSVSAISDDGYRYSDHPDAVAAFRAGLDALAALPCDILITPHPLASDLFARMGGTPPLIDAGACKAYAERGRAGLETRLAKQRSGAAP